MERREFVKLLGVGSVALAVPISFQFKKRYNGKCKCLDKHCVGEDSQPMTNTNPKYSMKSSGPILCEYHGALIKKLRLLTLPQLEYLCKRRERIPSMMVKDTMNIVVPPTNGKIKTITDKNMHNIRLIAMEVSDEYFKKNHRKIFGLV